MASLDIGQGGQLVRVGDPVHHRDGRARHRLQARRQVGELHRVAVAQGDRPLHGVLELAHIAWPAVVQQDARDLGRERGRGPAEALGLVGEQTLGEQEHVLAPLAERRQIEAEHVEAIEEVRAEPALLDERLEVLVGGGDDAHVRRDLAVATDRAVGALLKHAQELGLQARRKITDLVEKERSSTCLGEQSVAGLARVREGAADVPEELGLEQGVGHGGAVDGHEGSRCARGQAVNGAGDEHLAATGYDEKPVGAVTMTGRVEVKALGLANVGGEWAVGPNGQWHSRFDLPGGIGGAIHRYFDGESGWEVNPYRGNKWMDDSVVNELRTTGGGRSLFTPVQPGQKTGTVTRERFRDVPCFRVDVKIGDDAERQLYFDATTGLLFGHTGDDETTVVFQDWREHEGIQLPFHRIEFELDTGLEWHWKFSDASFEAPDPEAFVVPEDLLEQTSDTEDS